jgi:maleate cis-trans isomerase
VTPQDVEETRRFVPAGVLLHMMATAHETDSAEDGGITLKRVLGLAEDASIEEAAKGLAPLGVSAIIYGRTSASYVRGIDGAADIVKRIADATGLPASTTSTAAVAALRHLRIRRVAVLSPHSDALNEKLRLFLESSGFEVVGMRGLNMPGDIELLPPENIRDLVDDEVDRSDTDGVFVSCTSMRTAAVIDEIENKIRKPVVTALQATVWELLRLAGRPGVLPAMGRLYGDSVPAQSAP